MPANAKFIRVASADYNAAQLKPYFNGNTGPHWQCNRVVMQLGSNPSYAVISIPLKNLDDIAPALAGVSNSPMESLKIHTPVYVIGGDATTGVGSIIFAGNIVDVDEQFGPMKDRIAVFAECGKYWLKGFPIIGSFWASGFGDGASIKYRQGWHFHINPGGAPNCIFRDGIPVMCIPWQGISSDGSPSTDSNASETTACYWTPRSVLRYFQYCAVSPATPDGRSSFDEYPVLDSCIEWTDSVFNSISGDDSNIDRKAGEKDFDGMNMLGALEIVLGMAGPYSVFLSPYGSNDNKQELQFVRHRYAGGGLDLNRPSGAADTAMAKPRVIVEGNIKVSARDLYTRFIVSGAPVFIERRVCTHDPAGGHYNEGSLKWAWSAADEEEFRVYIQAGLNGGTSLEALLANAWRKWDRLFQAYTLDPAFDFQAGTTELAMPRCETGRPILSTLLTSIIPSTDPNPDNIAEQFRFRRPILFEYAGQDGATSNNNLWLKASYNDGLTIDADGTIWLPGLRESGQTFAIVQTGTAPNITVEVKVNKIRATVAIPCDHRMTKAFKISTDPGTIDQWGNDERNENEDPAGEGEAQIEKNHVRTYYASARELFNKEIRIDSYPVPISAGGSIASDTVLRNDISEISKHAGKRLEDFGYLARSGSLVFDRFTASFSPGMSVKKLGDYFIGAIISMVVHESSPNPASNGVGQFTELGLS